MTFDYANAKIQANDNFIYSKVVRMNADIRKQNLEKVLRMLEVEQGLDTYAKISEKYKISTGYLSQVRNDKRQMGEKFARDLEKVLGLPEFYMDKPINDGSNAEFSNKTIAFWSDGDPIPDGMVAIDFLPSVKAKLGNGYVNEKYQETEKLWFRDQTLDECNVDSDHAKAIRVSGDSMFPELLDGEVIAIDTSASRIFDGEIYAFRVGDELKVKYLFRHGDGFKAVSRNNDKLRFPDEIYTAKDIEADDIEVIGQFWWKSQTRKIRR